MVTEIAIKQRKCPKCGSTNGYVRIMTHEFVCRRCGTISKLEQKVKMYICPDAKTCKSIECGARVPHAKEPCKNHDYRRSPCSPIYSTIDGRILCPGCIEYNSHDAYLEDISSRVGQVPPDLLY